MATIYSSEQLREMGAKEVNVRLVELCNKVFYGNHKLMSRELGVSYSTMKDVLSNKFNAPSYETLRLISMDKKYNVNIEWIINGSGSMIKDMSGEPDPTVEELKEKLIEKQKMIDTLMMAIQAMSSK